MILDTQLTYGKNEVWTKVQIEYKLFCKKGEQNNVWYRNWPLFNTLNS